MTGALRFGVKRREQRRAAAQSVVNARRLAEEWKGQSIAVWRPQPYIDLVRERSSK